MSKLIDLVQKYSELPIKAWVDYEVVADDSGRWLGNIGNAEVVEYIEHKTSPYDDYERLIRKDDTEDLEEYLANYEEMSEEDIKIYIDNIKWEKAIFVDVDLPD